MAALEAEANAIHFLNEAFKHCKAIAASADALPVLEATYFRKKLPAEASVATALKEGVLVGKTDKKFAELFVQMIAQHRFWEREKTRLIPA